MVWNYASMGQSMRKRQMKGTWQIWEIMLSSNTISGTLGCHFGLNGVAILARFVRICSEESIRAWAEELMESLKSSNAPLWHHILSSNRTDVTIVHPARKPNKSLGSSVWGPAGVGGAQRESHSPVWSLWQLLQGQKCISPNHQHFSYTVECVFSCVYFSVATNLPAGSWSNY